MKPLRLYWLVKGEQDFKIGDKLITSDDEYGLDYVHVDETLKTLDLANDIIRAFEIKKINGVNMCNTNIYLTNQSKTILGIIPINKR